MTENPSDRTPKPSSRATRAAEELRANLARRKAQARSRRLEAAADGVSDEELPARDRDE